MPNLRLGELVRDRNNVAGEAGVEKEMGSLQEKNGGDCWTEIQLFWADLQRDNP